MPWTASAAEAMARRFYLLGASWDPANYRARAIARRRLAAPALARTLFADSPGEDYIRELREGRQRSRGRVVRADALAVTGRGFRVFLVVEERLWALGVEQPARRDAFQAIVRRIDGTPRIVEWSTFE